MKNILCAALLAFTVTSNFSAEPNTLTNEEKKDGWKLLFDGKSADQWHSIGKETFPSQGWVIEESTLRKIGGVKGGDVISKQTYSEFDLRWEWKVAHHANNGVKYFNTDERGGIGHEYQMLDDETEDEGKDNGKHSKASFYDVLPPFPNKPAALHKAGEWNNSRIFVKGNHVEHWLNGEKVLEYELGSDQVKEGVANSKFKKVPHFGERVKGHILLTDHNDEATFRSIKILDLSKD